MVIHGGWLATRPSVPVQYARQCTEVAVELLSLNLLATSLTWP